MEDEVAPVEDESVRVIPTEEVVRVYRLLEEMNRFLHQPLHYNDDSPVSQWLGTGVYAELRDVYYHLVWSWLPESEKAKIEEANAGALSAPSSDEEKNRLDFVEEIYRMRNDLVAVQADPSLVTYWQNVSLEPFLEAMAHWIEHRMPEMYGRRGRRLPTRETWQDLYNVLLIGAIYE